MTDVLALFADTATLLRWTREDPLAMLVLVAVIVVAADATGYAIGLSAGMRREAGKVSQRIADLKAENKALEARLNAAYAASGMSEAEFGRRLDAWMRDHEMTDADVDAMFE